MTIIYWIGMFLLIFGAISFTRIVDEDDSREDALKRAALLVMLIGFGLIAVAQPVLNWNREQETKAQHNLIYGRN